MKNANISFKTLVVITPVDCQRLLKLYPRLVNNIPYGEVCFVGAPEVGEIVCGDSELAERVSAIDENCVIPFNEVHALVAERMKNILAGRELPRGITGWYYQQFLKMQYAFLCEDEYYMVWDGDTIPCRTLNMFQDETGKPYFDLKYEMHQEYFETMGELLPGFHKIINKSFISEHMLFKTEYMKELVREIEANSNIPGTRFWEKILYAIPEEKIQSSAFSEFETYGTFVTIRHSDAYVYRDWHSFRLGGEFFSIDTISDRDFKWLAKDFSSISFEKGHSVRADNANLFDNPKYQQKLTPRQMLEEAQKEYQEGYKEVWDDGDMSMDVNVSSGQYNNVKNLIYLDWNNYGPDYLDQFFDESKVILSEVFTRDGSGIDAGEIPFYEGWDCLVVSFCDGQFNEVKSFVSELGIPGNKVIYVSDDFVSMDNPELTSILSSFWKLVIERDTKLKEYKQKAMGNYVAVSAEGMSFINTAQDECINYSMYVQKEVWAKDEMLKFYNMAQEKFSFTEEQTIFCDIGANIGTTSLYFKKNIDRDIEILAFEPSKENYKLYKINALLNEIDDSEVCLEKYGLSDSEYECEFSYNPINPGGSSIMTEDSWGQKEVVKMISFDEYAERSKLDVNRIKYIWVDVEGHEPEFIKGAKQTLKATNVPIIMEFTPKLYKGRYKEYIADLAEIYDTFSLAAGDWKKEFKIQSLLELEDSKEQLDLFLYRKK